MCICGDKQVLVNFCYCGNAGKMLKLNQKWSDASEEDAFDTSMIFGWPIRIINILGNFQPVWKLYARRQWR